MSNVDNESAIPLAIGIYRDYYHCNELMPFGYNNVRNTFVEQGLPVDDPEFVSRAFISAMLINFRYIQQSYIEEHSLGSAKIETTIGVRDAGTAALELGGLLFDLISI